MLGLAWALALADAAALPQGEVPSPNSFASGAQGAALTLRGDGAVYDLSGLVLRGSSPDAEPDARAGVGIRVLGRNITVKNARVHGYKVGLYAQDSPGLRLIDCDFSDNWKQRLKSGLDKEDVADWMSFHENEKDEWLRFGAGVYLRNCDGAEIKGVAVRRGQCGLMMTETDRALVWNSDFSFNSAIGIGMYASSRNRIMHNRIDWNVRGYSHGVYNRGQDSAGILIYQQSNKNTFAYNSVTHGGDGFFLWAGQSTMETGAGGCNDNLLYANDFSHAPTNGIEATFSRNAFVNNLLAECWHGIWGGYSYQSLAYGNTFAHNAEGIAWEHGQRNLIEANRFIRDRQAIVMWQKESEDPGWGYPKRRDTRAVDNTIRGNDFSDIADAVFVLNRTRRTSIIGNRIERAGQLLREAQENPVILIQPDFDASAGPAPLPATMMPSGNVIQGMDSGVEDYLRRFQTGWNPWQTPQGASEAMRAHAASAPAIPAPLKGGLNPFIRPGELRGRRWILVDEWGPYDFQSPRLWPRRLPGLGEGEMLFEILGPPGRWKVKSASPGLLLAQASGGVPGELLVQAPASLSGSLRIELEYIGSATTSAKGERRKAGQAIPFGWRETRMPIRWTTRYWNYDAATQDPRTQIEEWRKVVAGPHALTESGLELKKAWPGSPGAGVNANHFTTISEGVFEAQPGRYILDLTSDDGVRVFLDGRLIHDDWTYHAPKSERIPLELSGRHTLRIEHFELDGYSALSAVLSPAD